VLPRRTTPGGYGGVWSSRSFFTRHLDQEFADVLWSRLAAVLEDIFQSQEHAEEWKNLCEQAAVEQDPVKLHQLMTDK
jgi:hypothetical protein